MSTGKLAIVLLGAPNDEHGNLSAMAKERCDQAYAESVRHPDALILPTGGFGAHFNVTDKPHAFYTRNYLVGKGVDPSRFLSGAESGNTIQDAALAVPILQAAGVTDILLVTSEFHVERASFLFGRALEGTGISMSVSPSTTHVSPGEMERLRAHESSALARVKYEVRRTKDEGES